MKMVVVGNGRFGCEDGDVVELILAMKRTPLALIYPIREAQKQRVCLDVCLRHYSVVEQ